MNEPIIRMASDLTPEQRERVKRTALTVAVSLGDQMANAVLVGGLAPLFLVDQERAARTGDLHPGSVDVDLALDFAVLDERRYEDIERRLRQSGFKQGTNGKGNLSHFQWTHEEDTAVRVDFLMDEEQTDGAEQLLRFSDALGAMRMRAMALAFRAPLSYDLRETTLRGDPEHRPIRVCNPAVFVLLKTLAMEGRDKDKDAFDLVYVLSRFEGGPEAVAERWRTLGNEETAAHARERLGTWFTDEDQRGPRAHSRFVRGSVAPELAAEATGSVRRFLRALGR